MSFEQTERGKMENGVTNKEEGDVEESRARRLSGAPAAFQKDGPHNLNQVTFGFFPQHLMELIKPD